MPTIQPSYNYDVSYNSINRYNPLQKQTNWSKWSDIYGQPFREDWNPDDCESTDKDEYQQSGWNWTAEMQRRREEQARRREQEAQQTEIDYLRLTELIRRQQAAKAKTEPITTPAEKQPPTNEEVKPVGPRKLIFD